MKLTNKNKLPKEIIRAISNDTYSKGESTISVSGLLSAPRPRILGVEYKNKDFTGKQIAKDRGMKLVFNGRDHSFSSTSLRKRVASAQDN